MTLSEKIKLCFALLAVHIVLSIFTVIPGHFSVDEILYHMMTKNFIETCSFEIWNGYREFPSPELVYANTPVHNGRLISVCPYLYPVLSAPFYLLLGYRGLFLLNAISFIGVVFLTYGICQKFFKNKNLSLNACLILSLGTYAWGYSQAAWPHMTSTLFVMAAFYLFLCAFYGNDSGKSKSFYSAMACGFVSGLALGIRLDSILILPCFIFGFVFLKPWQPKLCFGMMAAVTPGLIILSATNYVKFGVLSPFSSGGRAGSMAGISELTKYFPLVTLILGIFFILWMITRYDIFSVLKKNMTVIVVFLFLLAIFFFMIPQTRTMLLNTLNGAYQLLVDFRIRDLGIREGGLSRSANGGMIYIGGLKKSLLQSCPYLVILLIPFLRIIKYDKESGPLILLFLIPIIYIGFFSYSGGWHGGQSLNLRYFVPILPFTSILTAFAWNKLGPGLAFSKNRRIDLLIFLIFFNITLILYLFFRKNLQYPDSQEFYCLNFPLILAFLALVLLLFQQMFEKKTWPLLYKTIAITLLVSMIWSGIIAFFYDFHYHRNQRRFNLENSILATEYISDNAILFTNQIDAFSHLIEIEKVRIANPFNDNFEDFNRLVAFHFQKGNNVYLSFYSTTWYRLHKLGVFNGYKIKHFKTLKGLVSGQVLDIPKTN